MLTYFVPSFASSDHLTRPYCCVAGTLTTGVKKENRFCRTPGYRNL